MRTAQDVFKREQMGSQMLLERMLHNSFMLCVCVPGSHCEYTVVALRGQ